MKKITFAAVLVCLLAAGCSRQTGNTTSSTASVTPTRSNLPTASADSINLPESVNPPKPSLSPGEVTFSGTLTVIDDESAKAGTIFMKIGNTTWVEAATQKNSAFPMGSLIGFNTDNLQSDVGKKVEVYGMEQNANGTAVTLTGNNAYFIKILN